MLMGTDVAEAVKKFPSPCDIKVHSVMCSKLIKLVDRVEKIVPKIEAALPHCSTGLDSLVSLISSIDEATSLVKDCCESSKLYLALSGKSILLRCTKYKNSFEKGLSHLLTMVHVKLAHQISEIIAEFRLVKFSLNPSEEEAGKAVRSLLEGYTTGNRESEKDWIQIAAQKLQITSSKALLFERRTIKKLLELDEGKNKQKKVRLTLLLHLLDKHRKSITSGHTENDINLQNQDYKSQTVDVHNDCEKDMSGSPPEEFICSISLKLMYDPVVIASGETFERMWIQKWLDEDNDTCPKTNKKLSNRLLIPNTDLKDQISKWCATNGVTISDPFIQFSNDNTWEYSTSSVTSLSSMYSLQLPVDFSSVSLSSLDNSRVLEDTREFNDDLSKEIDDALPWKFQCKFVEDLKARLENDDQACKFISCEKLVGSLMRFLKAARDTNDVKAQRIGCLLLLILVTKCRSINYLSKDAYQIIAEFLGSEVIDEALAITVELSAQQNCRSEIASSGSLPYIFKILDTRIRKTQKPALKILDNLTSSRSVRSLIVSSDLIPKLVTLAEDDSLSRYCIAILTNLCGNQDNKNIIAETKGCLSFVSKALDSENCEEQENALEILLSLCSQSVQYCRLVMDEDVFASLALITCNGSNKGKAKAHEMLRLLGDLEL